MVQCDTVFCETKTPARVIAKARAWARANPARRLEIQRRWDRLNRDKKAAYNRRPEVAARASARQKKRFATDPQFRMKVTMRGRIGIALRGIAKTAATLALLGCDIPTLRAHLEAQFKPGMSWTNYGRHGWHIDHIRPCASFDLTDPEQQRVCFHFSNLQPLWELENKTKADKLAA